MNQEQRSEVSRRPEEITVSIRTPAGFTHQFEVHVHDRVDKTVRLAVDYFVKHGQLAMGEYGLALVRDDYVSEMVDSSRLEDYDVVNGDTLHLIAKAPQVDG